MSIKYDIMLSQKINKTHILQFLRVHIQILKKMIFGSSFYEKVLRIENNNFEDSCLDTLCGISKLVMNKRLNHLDTFCIEFIARVS